MPARARLYICSIITVGVTLLAGCLLFEREFPDRPRYLTYLLLACVASTLKIKLPKIRGTMSISFVFILMGVVELTAAETITLGGLTALTQSFWKPGKQPTVVQALFNISTLVTSIAITFAVSFALHLGRNRPVQLAVAVCTFFLLNTGMVSLVLSLVENQPLQTVWGQCYLWSFPYYLAGAAIAYAITMSSRTTGWQSSLLILPVMYMVYTYYRLYLAQRIEQAGLAPIARSRFP
jgi:hypothetical protein